MHMSNLILLIRDSYLDYVKLGVKQDTMNLLRNAPMFGYGLFPDAAIMTAEQDIQKHEASSVAQGPGPGHTGIDLTTVRIGNLLPHLNRPPNSSNSLGDSSVGVVPGDVEGDGVSTLVSPNRSHTSHLNDNYWVGPTSIHVKPVQLDPKFQYKVMSESQISECSITQTVTSSVVSKTLSLLDVCYPVVNHVPTVHSHGPPQKKGVSPGQCLIKIKHVKGVSCVSPCLSVPIAPNVPNAVAGQNVGGRLQQFWHIWQESGGLSSEGRLHSSLQTEAPFDKVSFGSKWLRESHQKPVSKRSLGQSHRKVGSGKSSCQVVSGLLQLTLPSSQTQQKMEANLGSKSAKSILEDQFFQDGNSGCPYRKENG